MNDTLHIPAGASVRVAIGILLDAGVERREWKARLIALGYFKTHTKKHSSSAMIYLALTQIRKERKNDLLGAARRKRTDSEPESTSFDAVAGRSSKAMAAIVEDVHALVQRIRAEKGLPPWEFLERNFSSCCVCVCLELTARLTVIGEEIHCIDCRLPWGDDRVRDLKEKTPKKKRRGYIMPKHLTAGAGSLS